ncbi:hypothetical protein [Luteipulveratus flavus]|uniref:Uncharacterized protein n=1 Tax=Luteipulveratus flavus TaxID=3031728 RepID=A0ABT6C597_9MICO|nr:MULTISPECIES: hypothetical protein [unclassified Luteipulveratus]MDF8263229.1 hypothetical protein [Luteipulveratus sp. YIM 133296]
MTLTINEPWADRVGPDGVAAYVRILADVTDSYDDAPVAQVEEDLHARLDAEGLRLTDLAYAHLAEKIVETRGVGLCIVDHHGTVLHGTLAEADPPNATDDPEHPDRPIFS